MIPRLVLAIFGPNPKSTAAGIAMLIGACITVWRDPGAIVSPQIVAMVAGGFGLISAADGGK